MAIEPNFFSQPSGESGRLQAIERVCRIWAKGVPPEHDSTITLSRLIDVSGRYQRSDNFSPQLLESVEAVFCHLCQTIEPGIAAVCAEDKHSSHCWLTGLVV
ncbi:MAG: hypothetical protein IPM03_07675 [Sulfuritalea sp.]|nr:hypothetical protein [Sulfuritalea sp.]